MKKALSCLILCVAIPIVLIIGGAIFKGKNYALISMLIVILSCVPFFLSFERKEKSINKLILIAAMTAIAVVGRFVFYALPGFKPVTAIVVIIAIYFGSEAGFMVGALTAVISNFYFGQGPWTPFQMFTWGLIGFIAGLPAKCLKENRAMLLSYGALSGVLFSLIMDMWSTLWIDGFFSLARYKALIITSLGYTVMYAVSNVVFLCLLEKPIGKKLDRIKTKYGL